MWYARSLSTDRSFFLALLWAIAVFALTGCQEHEPNSNRWVTVESFREFSEPGQTINSHRIRNFIDSLMRADKDATTADHRTRSYYMNEGKFLWIDRKGVDRRADTLLHWLRGVGDMGFSTRRFCVGSLEQDLRSVRTLQLDSTQQGNVNAVLARLEYRLTKAYFRYVAGQRFGFTNPSYLLNRLDTIEPSRYDSVKRPIRYRGLFDIPVDRVGRDFFLMAVRKVEVDSLGVFLSEVQPRSEFYRALQKRLTEVRGDKNLRAKILCNMERCRWRQYDNPWQHEKYVVVNIPSFHLMAIDHQDTLSMRIGCGASKTKTPILNSHIKRMELNPQWFVPRSIVLHDMIHRVGNHGYFRARNYYVREVATGKEVDLNRVTRSMLISGAYGIAQRGGKGNALGRIIFRFDNNFSVFLHDTNSKGVFGQEDMGVSHGCIRIEKPYDFAVFLLADKNEKLKKKIYYSMTADSLANKKLIVGNVKVNPQVPLFITYYTLYPLAGDRIAEYPDVYGFDAVIFDMLRKYL